AFSAQILARPFVSIGVQCAHMQIPTHPRLPAGIHDAFYQFNVGRGKCSFTTVEYADEIDNRMTIVELR
ncbi:MAG: hypothetical protein GWN81_04865, partial [Phycisphaerae bacterium]|nr:hypothetical protein [Phycisphaerae bacterium]